MKIAMFLTASRSPDAPLVEKRTFITKRMAADVFVPEKKDKTDGRKVQQKQILDGLKIS